MPASPPPLFIVNPKAARARRIFPRVRERLAAEGIEVDVHETTAAGDATRATAAALSSGCDTVLAVGGDGTISETANGFFELRDGEMHPIAPNAVMALIPAGTGNDLAHGLGGDCVRTTDEWIDLLLAYLKPADGAQPYWMATDAIDVIHGATNDGANHFVVLNAATLGLGPEAAGKVAEQPKALHFLPGSVRFVLAAVAGLVRWRERFVKVTIDRGTPLSCQTNLLGVCNSTYAGGGMMLAPNARIDDGQFDLLLACGLTRAMIARELLRIRRGGHLENPCVRVCTATKVRVEAQTHDDLLLVEADGNLCGHTPAEFRILPGALRLLRPDLRYAEIEVTELALENYCAPPA
jgi:YegS/Rv2252/BmrU family lipid kinase